MTATGHLAHRAAPPSRLQLAHALAFACGLFGTLAGTLTANPYFFLIAGPCLSLSGVLILLGSRVAFRGPSGNMLRSLLGTSRILRLNLHAVVWILAGMLVSAWGVEGVRQRTSDRILPDPLISAYIAP